MNSAACVRSAVVPLRKREKSTSCDSGVIIFVIISGNMLTGMNKLSFSTALACGAILFYKLHCQRYGDSCSLRKFWEAVLEISIKIL